MNFPAIIVSTFLMFSSGIAYSQDYRPSLYVGGYVRHAKPTPRTHEGNMGYYAFSVEFMGKSNRYDIGIGSYVDSYGLRSYNIFSDISTERFTYQYFRPLLGACCSYKGSEYNSTSMKLLCFPLVKLRFGGVGGPFAKVTAIPHIGTLTNGLFFVEYGYQW